MGQIVLVAGNGLVEALAEGITAEVEALAPSVLVQIGCKVVVVSCEGCVFVSSFLGVVSKQLQGPVPPIAYLACLLGLFSGAFVVPMLEVFVDSGLLSSPVLLQHGGHATASLCRLAVHGLVELGIASVVLLFKCSGRHVE